MFQSNILSGVYIADYILIHGPTEGLIIISKIQPLKH